MLLTNEDKELIGEGCPFCGTQYTSREVQLGRPRKFEEFLIPIIRCLNCGFLHAWDYSKIEIKTS